MEAHHPNCLWQFTASCLLSSSLFPVVDVWRISDTVEVLTPLIEAAVLECEALGALSVPAVVTPAAQNISNIAEEVGSVEAAAGHGVRSAGAEAEDEAGAETLAAPEGSALGVPAAGGVLK